LRCAGGGGAILRIKIAGAAIGAEAFPLMEVSLPRPSPVGALSDLSPPNVKSILTSGFKKTESFVDLRKNFTKT
jgi:hypothetical protein